MFQCDCNCHKNNEGVIELLKDKKVTIDFGHGGSDPGAVGIMGVIEKNLVLEIGQILIEKLKDLGVKTYVTRNKDEYVSLKSRCDISNNSDSDLFVSLHCNAFNKESAKGLEVYHHPKSKYGSPCSKIILDEIINAGLYTRNRGVKTSDRFYVLKRTRATAVLIELGFITNYEDLQLIQTNKYNFANVLANSITKCLQKI